MTSYPISTLSPYRFHENTTNIPDISPTIFDITATVSVSSRRWHTHLYRCIALSVTSKQVCMSSHLAHVWHHTQSISDHIHTIWHQWPCIMTSHTRHSWNQISSLWHHIHSLGHHTTLCKTWSPWFPCFPTVVDMPYTQVPFPWELPHPHHEVASLRSCFCCITLPLWSHQTGFMVHTWPPWVYSWENWLLSPEGLLGI